MFPGCQDHSQYHWSGAPASTWLLCLLYVWCLLNHTFCSAINCVPSNVVLDLLLISAFHFWELVYYKEDGSNSPSDSHEAFGHMMGIAEHVDHAMTYKVLTEDTHKIIYHSNLWSATSNDPNLWSPTWVATLQMHHPQINGTNYYAQCVKLIWTAVLQIWKIRNQHLHPRSYEQEDRSLLEAEVHRIFQEAQQDFILQDMIANLTPEQVLQRPTRRVRQWVSHSNNHIRAHHKATQLQAKLKTQDIRKFFPWINSPPPSHAADKNLLRPP